MNNTPYGTGRYGDPLVRSQRLTVYLGILCLVLVLVIMQLWLLMATMNAFLAGDNSIIWPAAISSTVCFALNLGLLFYLYRVEHDMPAPPPADTSSTGLASGISKPDGRRNA